MQLPFTVEGIGSLLSKPLILAEGRSSRLEKQFSLVLKGDGKIEADGVLGLTWEVEDGHFSILESGGKKKYRFKGIETCNGSMYMRGDNLDLREFDGQTTVFLFKANPLGDYRICVNSHVDYEKEALPRLLRSLKKVGVSSPLVVIGGATEESECEIEGFKCRRVENSLVGHTVLKVAAEEDYNGCWLLLHDTCEVDSVGFGGIRMLDYGLNYDMLLFLDVDTEIGIYSSVFLKRLKKLGFFEGKAQPFSMLVKFANLFMEGVINHRHVNTKDVYGTGTSRKVLYLDGVGIKKYRRVDGTQIKP